MKVVKKDAAIENTGKDDEFPGSFRVVLSAPTKDRDGDTLRPEEWKQPLPEHVTFDQDHLMSVAGTVGSGAPHIDEKTGNLIVEGTYSSLPRAQDVRTLVKEGHINRTSVAFMTERIPQKDGAPKIVRELLNGAFVAIPSNREAVVLDAKGLKAGSRNSKSDQDMIQGIHDHATGLGADCAGTAKSLNRKDAEDGTNPVDLITAVDAAIDSAIDLLSQVDPTILPAEVQQAIALIQAADTTVDELLDVLGIEDPDEGDDGESATGAASAPMAGAAKAAPAVGAKAAPTSAQTDELQLKATRFRMLSRLAKD